MDEPGFRVGLGKRAFFFVIILLFIIAFVFPKFFNLTLYLKHILFIIDRCRFLIITVQYSMEFFGCLCTQVQKGK